MCIGELSLRRTVMFKKIIFVSSSLFLISSASADIYVTLGCEDYKTEEAKSLCKSYEEERMQAFEENSILHKKLKDLKAQLRELSE